MKFIDLRVVEMDSTRDVSSNISTSLSKIITYCLNTIDCFLKNQPFSLSSSSSFIKTLLSRVILTVNSRSIWLRICDLIFSNFRFLSSHLQSLSSHKKGAEKICKPFQEQKSIKEYMDALIGKKKIEFS